MTNIEHSSTKITANECRNQLCYKTTTDLIFGDAWSCGALLLLCLRFIVCSFSFTVALL